jgi:peptidoglycan/xylan/chitin deacetylase (PgdA/CDA1 family)
MYHHVADVDHDPWQLAVAPRHFAEHLAVLRASGRPLLRLDELEAALAADRVPRRAVAVTFDDGYADNALVALPALERADVPATVFVTTGAIDAPREMWWDELERTILAPPVLPAVLELDVGGVRVARPVAGAAPAPGWRAAREAPTSAREALYHDLWALLTPLRADDQRAVLDHLAAWAAVDLTPRPTHRMATTEELERLVRSPLVEIGSHTATHPSLPGCAALEAELACSKEELEARCDGPVRSFAYPSGHHDDRTVAAVGAAGYRSAVTVRGGVVRRGDDPFRLPRIAVGDVDGDGFARLLARRG